MFLIAGPAANAASVAIVWKMLGTRTALVYVLSVACTALAFGSLVNWLFGAIGAKAVGAAHHELLPHGVNLAMAWTLLTLLAHAWLRGRLRPAHDHDDGARTTPAR